MEEQELRCPWCGGPLEKGQLWGDDCGFMKEGCRGSFLPAFKRVTEKEEKREIHTVFRRFPFFCLTKNLSLPALAYLFRVSLHLVPQLGGLSPGLCLPFPPEDYSALLNPVSGKEHEKI